MNAEKSEILLFMLSIRLAASRQLAMPSSTVKRLHINYQKRTLLGLLSLVLFGLIIGCGGGNLESVLVETTDPVAEPDEVYLPKLAIETENLRAVASKENYVGAAFEMTDLDETLLHEGAMKIKGRGNSSWELMPKKSFRLKLTEPMPLMGMPKNKHWVLLANFADKTLLRNMTAFELSRMLKMEYTPRSVFVELYLNGSYEGVYQLTEHIRIAKNRLDIPELTDSVKSADTLSGGYLIEIDDRRGEDFCIDAYETEMVFCVSNPKSLLEPEWQAHREYIVNYIHAAEESLFSDNFDDPESGYAAYINVDSAIAYYVINEVFKNVDGNLRLSTFMFKRPDGKLTFGPIWDFDIAVGNVDYSEAGQPDGWYIRNAAWFERLFEDPVFEQKVIDRWNQIKRDALFEQLIGFIEKSVCHLQEAQKKNFIRWPILSTYVWPNRVVTGSYEKEIETMIEWFKERVAWMDSQFLGLSG